MFLIVDLPDNTKASKYTLTKFIKVGGIVFSKNVAVLVICPNEAKEIIFPIP